MIFCTVSVRQVPSSRLGKESGRLAGGSRTSAGRRRCFGVETVDEIAPGRGPRRQHFQGDDAIDAELARFENDAGAGAILKKP